MDWGEKNWWKTHDWQSNHLFVFFVCLQVWRIFSVFPQEKEFEMSDHYDHYNHNDVHLYYLYHHHLDDEKWWEMMRNWEVNGSMNLMFGAVHLTTTNYICNYQKSVFRAWKKTELRKIRGKSDKWKPRHTYNTISMTKTLKRGGGVSTKDGKGRGEGRL